MHIPDIWSVLSLVLFALMLPGVDLTAMCYSGFKQGYTSSTFKQTKCKSGDYAYRFESAELILPGLLAVNIYGAFPQNPTSGDATESTSLKGLTASKTNKEVTTQNLTTTAVPEATTTIEEDYNFQIITKNNSKVSTPNFPSNYNNKMSLWFSIRPPDKLSRVSLTFTAFDLEDSPDCIADSVQLLGTLDSTPKCAKGIPSPVESLGNVLEIYFKSDTKTTSTGFEAVIRFLDPDIVYRTPAPGICESVNLHSNGSQYLRSPRGGHRNIQCGYIIHADVGNVIQLSFSWFQLEDCESRDTNADFEPEMSSYDIPEVILGIEHDIDVDVCLCDSLQIFDGLNVQAPNLTDRLCSFETPSITPTSTGNVMYIYLETDNEVRTGGFGINVEAIDVEAFHIPPPPMPPLGKR